MRACRKAKDQHRGKLDMLLARNLVQSRERRRAASELGIVIPSPGMGSSGVV